MKKILLALAAVFMLNACSEVDHASLKGKIITLATDKNITLSFDAKEDRFYGKALNNYFGTYKAEKDNIKFGPVASTMMAGPEDEMKKEHAYFQNLDKVRTYSLKGKELELKGDGVTLKYLQQ